MKYEDFKGSGLHCVQMWVIVDIKGSEAHVFENIQDKEDKGRWLLSKMLMIILCMKGLERI